MPLNDHDRLSDLDDEIRHMQIADVGDNDFKVFVLRALRIIIHVVIGRDGC